MAEFTASEQEYLISVAFRAADWLCRAIVAAAVPFGTDRSSSAVQIVRDVGAGPSC